MTNGSSPTPPSSNAVLTDTGKEALLPTPERVLLVLGAQVALLSDAPLGVPAAGTVGSNIMSVLAAARAAPKHERPRIVHVQNSGTSGDPDEPHTPGWALVYTPLPDEYVLDKCKNSAFAGTSLEKHVPCDAELIVIGLQSDFCVRATCSEALARGNEVVLIRGAHATYDRLEVWDGEKTTPADQVAREIEEELEEAGVILLDMEDLPNIFTDR
ncbi:Isochorismatase hydrolase [Wolfiporia cocos MD-104 SS10]|uniref:Isochorismatase hydrolase n=1 Tax=Wolfiporia cocos (strain MD-104) TaxID=742152 RepID=A0A2H3JUV1_WOLCO|nr:Isochorismatase hydrolase [Wolfiporia cocos MD-104 SS10]